MKKVATLVVVMVFATGLLPVRAQTDTDLPFDKPNRVIYDNDDHRDVYTDEFLIALSHLGKIDLQAIITTYAPNETAYREFVAGRAEIVEAAQRSDLQNLPEAHAGTHDRLTRPASGRIDDTRSLDLVASLFIVEAAQLATPEDPLVIVTGGQLTTVANAYLLDPSIADRVVVSGIFGVQTPGYNAGLDEWAWKIALARFRVLAVPVGPPGDRGTVYMKPPQVPKDRIRTELPQNEPFFRWMFEKHHPSNGAPAGHDFDGQAAIPLIRPGYITEIQRWKVRGLDNNGALILEKDPNGPIYESLDANQSVATDAFWSVMNAAAESIR